MDLENWNSIIWIVVLNWKIGTLLYGNLELYCMEFWNSIVWNFGTLLYGFLLSFQKTFIFLCNILSCFTN